MYGTMSPRVWGGPPSAAPTANAAKPTANASDLDYRYETTVELATRHYSYSDSIVVLSVGRRIFKVARGRLTQRSQVLRDLFSVPQPPSSRSREIVLHNDPDDFEHFLWFIHADPIDYMAFDSKSTDYKETFDRCISIASVAHMYEVLPAANWAVDKALTVFKAHDIWHPTDVNRLLQTAALWCNDSSQRWTSARSAVAKMIHTWAHGGWEGTRASRHSSGLAPLARTPRWHQIGSLITALEERGETWLLGHLYYYVLVYTTDEEKSAASLRPLDNQRLLRGFYTLVQKGILLGKGKTDRELFHKQGVGIMYPSPPMDLVRYQAPGRIQDLGRTQEADTKINAVRDQLWSYFNSESWAT